MAREGLQWLVVSHGECSASESASAIAIQAIETSVRKVQMGLVSEDFKRGQEEIRSEQLGKVTGMLVIAIGRRACESCSEDRASLELNTLDNVLQRQSHLGKNYMYARMPE
jgi:hypothetical protein